MITGRDLEGSGSGLLAMFATLWQDDQCLGQCRLWGHGMLLRQQDWTRG
jgi:hypothetical protein